MLVPNHTRSDYQGHRLRTRLELLQPNLAARVEVKQLKQKEVHVATARHISFEPGSKVYVRNYGVGPKWLSGEVMQVSGAVTYVVQLESGQRRRCHVNQLYTCQMFNCC